MLPSKRKLAERPLDGFLCAGQGKRGRGVGKLGFKGFGLPKMRLMFIHQAIRFFEIGLNIRTLGFRVQRLEGNGKSFIV